MEEEFEIIDLSDGYHISELSADDRAIQPLAAAMQLTVNRNERNRGGPLFHADLRLSDPTGRDFGMNVIYEMFSRGLPNKRRMMSCEICETFIRDFGNLCCLSDDGTLVPFIWPGEDIVPDYYRQAVTNVRKLFVGRPLGEEFRSHLETAQQWLSYYARKSGNLDTYDHMDVSILGHVRAYHGPTESEHLAEVLERILADNDEKIISQTHVMLMNDVLPHVKLYQPWIAWLKNVAIAIKVRDNLGPEARKTLIAKYSFLAAEGCLPSLYNGELAKLMSFVRAGEGITSIQSKWMQIVNPQDGIPPKDIARTMLRLISDLGYNTTCFYRLFIKIGQIPTCAYLWTDSSKPSAIPRPLFQPLDSKRQSVPITVQDALDRAPIKKSCFRKFCLEVTPQASSLSIYITEESKHAENLHFLTTGVDDPVGRTKPIYTFQNPGEHTASWFRASHITSPEEANLCAGWVKVKCIVSFPHMWDYFQAHQKSTNHQFFNPTAHRGFEHKDLGMKFLLVLDGINDNHGKGSDLSAELLNEELRCFSREQLESYRDLKSIRGSHINGHIGGVAIESDRFRKVMLGVRMKSGEFVRYEVVKYKYYVEQFGGR
ncbi:hypothetical protein BPAE_0121g00370 [Botrytis paeoniae]|uniref:Uncharacterized protein n=1 Tax=Botrytis paeoniae TaxID=278948 RepID=A0A4Z1FJX7_9HELO|nr:hypothetical protein BPAE_0121g00370 [Botrytis paeoniae]